MTPTFYGFEYFLFALIATIQTLRYRAELTRVILILQIIAIITLLVWSVLIFMGTLIAVDYVWEIALIFWSVGMLKRFRKPNL
jgi:hypothetical protein